MKTLLPIALATIAFGQVSPATQTTAGPLPHEHWQRQLLLPAGKPAAEQCVVLDAEVFATAAPGLRDVRLLQSDRELPYAVDESHDDRETGSSIPIDDRSIFETVGVAPLSKPPNNYAGQPDLNDQRTATFLLPAHVPVERITLRGSSTTAVSVVLRATPQTPFATASGSPPEAEIVRMQAPPGNLSLPLTVGANLQHMARLEVTVTPAPSTLTSVALEMRRRELCYKPITDQPVRMVYGDPDAHLIHYDYALHYQPTATPVLATMGPRETNPAYAAPIAQQPFTMTLKQKLAIAIGLCVGMLAVTMGVLLRFRR